MSEIKITVCSHCNRAVGNKMTVTVRGLLLCSLFCGRAAVGESAYLEAWNEKAKEINLRNNRHSGNTGILRIAK